MTLTEKIDAVRAAWLAYQRAASAAGRADVPECAAYWRAVRAVQEQDS